MVPAGAYRDLSMVPSLIHPTTRRIPCFGSLTSCSTPPHPSMAFMASSNRPRDSVVPRVPPGGGIDERGVPPTSSKFAGFPYSRGETGLE